MSWWSICPLHSMPSRELTARAISQNTSYPDQVFWHKKLTVSTGAGLTASSQKAQVRPPPSTPPGAALSKTYMVTAVCPHPLPLPPVPPGTLSGRVKIHAVRAGHVTCFLSSKWLLSCSSALVTRSNTLPSRRTLKNSRLVCKKDDVHVCIMCLRAVMNYQVRLACSTSDRRYSHQQMSNEDLELHQNYLGLLVFLSMDSTWWCLILTLSMRLPSASITGTLGKW